MTIPRIYEDVEQDSTQDWKVKGFLLWLGLLVTYLLNLPSNLP